MMLNFKDYFEKDEAFNPLNFAGGFATNLANQASRGTGNILKGATKTTAGAIGTAGGLLGGIAHGILGGKDNVKSSVDLAKDSVSLFSSGLSDIVKGVIQLGGSVSLITPFLRGVQASAEPFLPRRFNRNRNKLQKLFGFNSSKETPFLVVLPNTNEELISLVNQWYDEAKNKREVQVKGKPEFFIKKFMTLYNSSSTSFELNKKIKYLLNTYFSNFEVVLIEAGKLIKLIDNQVFYSDSKIIKFIDFLHEKSKSPNTVLITQDNSLLLDELIKIHNNYLSSKNLILGKNNSSASKYLIVYKNKIVDIIVRFFPNKKLKTSKRD